MNIFPFRKKNEPELATLINRLRQHKNTMSDAETDALLSADWTLSYSAPGERSYEYAVSKLRKILERISKTPPEAA